MAITKEGGRQWLQVAKVNFGFADLTDGAAEEAVTLHAGSGVIRASLTITEVFNSATSDTIALSGAGVTLGATDVTALGTTEATAFDSTVLAVNDTVDVTWNGTGAAPTTGAGFVLVEVFTDGKANEVVPV